MLESYGDDYDADLLLVDDPPKVNESVKLISNQMQSEFVAYPVMLLKSIDVDVATFSKEIIVTESCYYLVRDKLNNLVLFDQSTYDKLLKEVPSYKLITPAIVSERMKIRGSLARHALEADLHRTTKAEEAAA
ncbi:hypothetical protein QYM36_004861 [Artemia franciscana]|uniref:40S ribosomal protein S25 n=1 Tax=Artemia franciscana TaxID=6661 RepID=A0AA88I089_ARTSF|nr:hypothetical protein QYM36_004861 [Artemia franciscana]